MRRGGARSRRASMPLRVLRHMGGGAPQPSSLRSDAQWLRSQTAAEHWYAAAAVPCTPRHCLGPAGSQPEVTGVGCRHQPLHAQPCLGPAASQLRTSHAAPAPCAALGGNMADLGQSLPTSARRGEPLRAAARRRPPPPPEQHCQAASCQACPLVRLCRIAPAGPLSRPTWGARGCGRLAAPASSRPPAWPHPLPWAPGQLRHGQGIPPPPPAVHAAAGAGAAGVAAEQLASPAWAQRLQQALAAMPGGLSTAIWLVMLVCCFGLLNARLAEARLCCGRWFPRGRACVRYASADPCRCPGPALPRAVPCRRS